VKAATLMANSDGSFRNLNDIATYVYSNALLTATGVLNGQQVSIEDWSAASEFCTGKKIVSPCDTLTKTTGPLSPKCLSYLWNNEGASKPIGATYSLWSMASSLFPNTNDQTPQFCRTTGTMSPMSPNGTENSRAINYWQNQGGVEDVKSKMNMIHQMANHPANFDDSTRSHYISQCYGPISLAPPATQNMNTDGCLYPSGTDSGVMCKRKRATKVVKSVTVRQNCDRTSGWAKEIKGTGTYRAGSGFPSDASYIIVPAGVTAILRSQQWGWPSQTVVGPGEFNFCSRSGFNDNVAEITIS